MNPKIYAILGIIIALGGIGFGVVRDWSKHDAKEQTIGQASCVEAAASTGTKQATDSAGIDRDNAKILSDQVGDYDAKIRDLNAANADLAQRLHDARTEAANLRGRALPGVSGSTGQLPRAADNSEPSDCDRRQAVDLEACAANTIELMEIRTAWQKLADRAKKKGSGEAAPR
jgi:hypothetical protein